MTEKNLALVPDTKVMDAKALTYLEFANEIAIANDEQYVAAGQFVLDVKKLLKEINDTFDDPIKKQREALESLRDAKKKHAEPLEKAEGIVKPKLVEWKKESDRRCAELEKKLQKEAEAREAEARKAEVAALKSQGKPEEAKALAKAPVAVAPISVTSTLPKVKGISFATAWDFKIADEQKIPREFLSIDMVKIRGVVERMGKDATKIIAGIEVFEKTGARGKV